MHRQTLLANARTTTEITPARSPRKLHRPLCWMVKVWGLWIIFYFGAGLFALEKGETGFFASTVDRVESLELQLLFLNLPLQLVLMAVSLTAARFGSRAARRLSNGAGYLATTLVAAHVLLSFATALRDLTSRI